MVGISDTWTLQDEYIQVKYNNSDPVALIEKCKSFLADYGKSKDKVYEEFGGSRMLASQLDLMSKAKDKVDAIIQNCQKILEKDLTRK